ncbi:unnamed protein product, partial [Brachionus calyciflorus]
MVGQCYDGASNMNGEYKGLSNRIKLEAPNALYIHCYAHRLNLAMQDSCNNIKEYVTHLVNETRWASRFNALKAANENYLAIIETLKEIDNIDKNCLVFSLYLSIFSFDFLFFLDVLTYLFGLTNILSQQLQSTDLDYKNIKELADAAINKIKRLDEIEQFDKFWNKNLNLASELGINLPEESRIRKKPKRFVNGDETYQNQILLLKTVLRHQIHQIEPIVTIFSIITSKENIDEDFIKKKLGNFVNLIDEKKLFSELKLWFDFKEQMNFDLDLIKSESRLNKLREFFLKDNVSKAFSEIFTLFRIYLSFPISNANAERSFSVLRRIKNYLRNSMSQERLNDISISIESEEADLLDVDNILEVFVKNILNRLSKIFDMIPRSSARVEATNQSDENETPSSYLQRNELTRRTLSRISDARRVQNTLSCSRMESLNNLNSALTQPCTSSQANDESASVSSQNSTLVQSKNKNSNDEIKVSFQGENKDKILKVMLKYSNSDIFLRKFFKNNGKNFGYTSYLHFTRSIDETTSKKQKIIFDCIFCEAKFKAILGATSNIKAHLERHIDVPGLLNWFNEYNASNSLQNKKKINVMTIKLVKYFIASNSAFAELDSPHFRDLFQLANFETPCSKSFSEKILPEVFNMVNKKIDNKLNKALSICLICDIWTNKQMMDFLGIACNLTNENFEKEVIIVGMIKMHGKHNAENINIAIEDLINRFSFDKSLISDFPDNESEYNNLGHLERIRTVEEESEEFEDQINEVINYIDGKVYENPVLLISRTNQHYVEAIEFNESLQYDFELGTRGEPIYDLCLEIGSDDIPRISCACHKNNI